MWEKCESNHSPSNYEYIVAHTELFNFVVATDVGVRKILIQTC